MVAYWLNVITFLIHCATTGLVSTQFVFVFLVVRRFVWDDKRWYGTRTPKGLIPVSLAVILGLYP